MPISAMNRPYGVSQSTLIKVVNQLVNGRLPKITRGRTGGVALARKSGSAKWRASWKAVILCRSFLAPHARRKMPSRQSNNNRNGFLRTYASGQPLGVLNGLGQP